MRNPAPKTATPSKNLGVGKSGIELDLSRSDGVCLLPAINYLRRGDVLSFRSPANLMRRLEGAGVSAKAFQQVRTLPTTQAICRSFGDCVPTSLSPTIPVLSSAMDPAYPIHVERETAPGELQAAADILPLVYDELRKLAAAKMARESAAHTLQPTALVHEAWLRLGKNAPSGWKSRAQFFSAAAEAMRRILIENARRRGAVRHGAGMEKVRVDDTGVDVPAPQMTDATLLLLNEALENFAAQDPRKAELVKQCYFVGLTVEEAAEVLGVSLRTAERDWHYARAWLLTEVERLGK